MRALQALVIVMGILLLAGSAVIAVTIMHRMSAGTLHANKAPTANLPPRVKVDLPSGVSIKNSFSLGDRLALHITGPAGDAVLVIDPASGAIVETISLSPQPSPQP